MTNELDATLSVHHPVFTIEHIAALFHVSVDRAREYTYRDDFPASFDLGARNLWDREEVLTWFRTLPRRTRCANNSAGATRTAAARARRSTTGQPPKAGTAGHAAASVITIPEASVTPMTRADLADNSYKPRKKQVRA